MLNLGTREAAEQIEEEWLAPYAMKTRLSRGRKYDEPQDPFRTLYRRDHDRVIHTRAFRRLEYKTQVFVNDEGDHYRTRLTHSIEVSQIAVSVARMLRLNEDLSRVVALAHDIGHPPFGHAGEYALNRLMRNKGGFNHNLQGLRIVDLLEMRYPQFPGLNLSWEVREGMNKHLNRNEYAGIAMPVAAEESPLLEAQVTDLVDEIAYDNHDLDDGLASGILQESQLDGLEIWQRAKREAESLGPIENEEVRRYQIIRALINSQINDLVWATQDRLEALAINSLECVRECTEKIVQFSASMQQQRQQLKTFLWDSMYRHERIARMTEQAYTVIEALYPIYLNHPEHLPEASRTRLETTSDPERVVCDYIAGMTDRFCLAEFQRLI